MDVLGKPETRCATDVFRWRDKSRWRAAVLEMFGDFITPKVLKVLRSDPPEDILSGDLEWLTNPTRRAVDFHGDWFQVFEARFPRRFPFVRLVHGCRPISWKSYRDTGLRLSNIEQLQVTAREIFGASDSLQAIFDELAGKQARSNYAAHNGGRIFVCLDRRELLNHSGQYVAYGSEYLLCVAARLRAEQLLGARGIPTVIHCDLPYHWIDQDTRRSLMGTIFEDLFSHLLGAQLHDYQGLNFGFPLHQPVPPQFIARIERVRNLRYRR